VAVRRKTEQYYPHNFYRHQPNLNLANPRVRDEVAKIMGFWLQLGLSGDGYGPVHVNAASQRNDPESLLQFFQLLIERYRSSSEIGWGRFELLTHGVDSVLAHVMIGEQGSMIAVHNFSCDPQVVTIAVPDAHGVVHLAELLVDGRCTTDKHGSIELSLPGYGYRWLRIHHDNDLRLS